MMVIPEENIRNNKGAIMKTIINSASFYILPVAVAFTYFLLQMIWSGSL